MVRNVAPPPSRAAVAGNASQAARRQRIVDAALELLQDRPYDQIQIRDVAEAAGVALGTLYRYFPSKEELFAHVLLEWSRRFDSSARRTTTPPSSDAERLLAVLRQATRAFERHPNFFGLITQLEVISEPAVAGPFREYSEAFRRELAAAMPDTDPADVGAVTTMATALIGTLLRSWWLGAITMRSVYDQLEHSVRIIFSGAR